MPELVIFILAILVFIEGIFKPRIDVTNCQDVILWVNRKGQREPIILFNIKL